MYNSVNPSSYQYQNRRKYTKMSKLFLLALIVVLLVPAQSTIQKINLPQVNKYTQRQIQFQLNYLKLLVRTFNWRGCNTAMLYAVSIRLAKLLHTAALEMRQGRGNIVQGVDNAVMGYGNIVIGSNNGLVGLNNWCFTSGYSTPASQYDEGVLAIGNYKIWLAKAEHILHDPTEAIQMIDSSELDSMKRNNAAMSFFFK